MWELVSGAADYITTNTSLIAVFSLFVAALIAVWGGGKWKNLHSPCNDAQQQSERGLSLPPVVAGGLPLLGNALQLARGGGAFLEECAVRYGERVVGRRRPAWPGLAARWCRVPSWPRVLAASQGQLAVSQLAPPPNPLTHPTTIPSASPAAQATPSRCACLWASA